MMSIYEIRLLKQLRGRDNFIFLKRLETTALTGLLTPVVKYVNFGLSGTYTKHRQLLLLLVTI